MNFAITITWYVDCMNINHNIDSYEITWLYSILYSFVIVNLKELSRRVYTHEINSGESKKLSFPTPYRAAGSKRNIQYFYEGYNSLLILFYHEKKYVIIYVSALIIALKTKILEIRWLINKYF